MVWRRALRQTRARVALAILAALAAMALLAPYLAPADLRDRVDLRAREQPPSPAHPLGTDELGRDVWARLVWGGRVSLAVAAVAAGLGAAVGTAAGALAGFYGGWVDAALMRGCDLFLAVPALPLALVAAAALRPGIWNTMVILGLLGWTVPARLMRAEMLSLREREYVLAARAVGVPEGRILWRHLVPGALPPVLVAASLGAGSAILAEAALSFLGLGVPQPVPTWGNMLTAALSPRLLAQAPWIWLPPAACIFLAVAAANLLGDALRDALEGGG